jgi:hypothetical protein
MCGTDVHFRTLLYFILPTLPAACQTIVNCCIDDVDLTLILLSIYDGNVPFLTEVTGTKSYENFQAVHFLLLSDPAFSFRLLL